MDLEGWRSVQPKNSMRDTGLTTNWFLEREYEFQLIH